MSDERSNEQAVPSQGAPSERGDMSSSALAVEAAPVARGLSFDAAFEQHYAHVRAVLYRLVGDEADDLAQEVFLRLYLHPPQAPDSDVGAWLYRVAVNLGYNALRAQRRREQYAALSAGVRRLRPGRHEASEEPAVSMQSTEPGPEAWLERREEQRAVQRALARLNEQQATLLVLRYGGLTYRQVAEALGVSPGSVGTLLARAERALQRAYGQLVERATHRG